MRTRWLLPLLLLLAAPAHAQNPGTFMPSCRIAFSGTAAGTSANFNNVSPTGSVNTSCTNWSVVYSSVGFSAISLEIDSAPDSVTPPGTTPGAFTIWPAAQIAAGQTMPLTSTTSGSVTFFGFFPWLRINVSSTTGTGSFSAFLYGWQTQGSQESNTGATQVQGVTAAGSSPSGNPVQFAMNAPTNSWSCLITLSTNTTTQCQAAPAAGQRNYVTSYSMATTTAGTTTAVQLSFGTGSNCATGLTALSANTPNVAIGTVNWTGGGGVLKPTAANAICGTQAGTTAGTTSLQISGFVAP